MGYGFTDFQRLVHSVPEEVSRFLGGGRGGAKTEATCQDIAIGADRYGEKYKHLFIRQGPWSSMEGIVSTLDRVFTTWWGRDKHTLKHDTHIWHLPRGAMLQLGILPDGEKGRKYYEATYQGRSFPRITVDERQMWGRSDVVDLLTSNLRGEIPTRMVMAANPGGRGHQAIVARWINNGVGPWHPFEVKQKIKVGPDVIETSRTWISCPSTYRDNPHNGPDYLANLAASASNDPELLAAWINGNWNIARGSYFASVLANPEIQTAWPHPEQLGGWDRKGWRFWLAFDHGTAAPSVCYVVARSEGAFGPDGLYYPYGSLVMADEYACHRTGDLSAGLGWTVPKLAEPIKALAARWGLKPEGYADDAIFSKGGGTDDGGDHKTIGQDYARAGVKWKPAGKGTRAARFQRMRSMLASAGDPEDPGLYVDRRCMYWWETVPFIQHDPTDREAPEKCGTDHGLDASSYGMQQIKVRRGSGTVAPWG